jgi:hypothetical protein
MNKTLPRIFIVLVFLLTACGQTSPVTQATPVPVIDNATATPSLLPTATRTSLPTTTPTASITPLPTIPTFTPTFDELVQSNPFPSDTPNPDIQAIAQKWNTKNVKLSPDGQWATIVDFGILHIVQVHGSKELTIKCETFIRCEFIIPLQWSPNSEKLYVVPLLTGEFLVTFPLNTGIGRLDVKTGKFEKLVEDGTSEGDYNASLSPDGNFIAITDTREDQPKFIIMDTKNLQVIEEKVINITLSPHDYGIAIGNMIWTQEMDGIVFAAESNSSISSILYYDVKKKSIKTVVDKDPSFIELLFIDENNRVALSKTAYYPFSKSYWYFDLSTNELIPISSP